MTTVKDCDGNEITLPAIVISPRNHRAYHVLRITPDGRLVLSKHGWPTVRDANPGNWRLVPRLEMANE